MDTDNPPEKKKHSRQARYIRFTAGEYKKIEEDEVRSKKSAQELLKSAYFSHGPTVILMTDEERDRLCTQLQKVGSNINQIAKKVNSGFALGFEQELETVRAQLSALLAWMTAKYKNHRE